MNARLRARLRRLQIPRDLIGMRADWLQRNQHPAKSFVTLGVQELRRHCYVIGATGTGKTTLLTQIMAHDIRRRHSFTLFDQRGDLANAVVELLPGNVNPARVAYFDLREKEGPTPFNPLSGSGEDYYKALGVLDAVRTQSESWGVQLDQTLRNALLALAPSGGSLTDLEPFLTSGRVRRQLLCAVADEKLLAFWSAYDAMSPERQSLLSAPVLNKISPLTAIESLRRMLGHPQPTSLAAYLDTPGSVILASLAVDETHASGRMAGSLLMSSLTREVFARVETPECERNPLHLFIDEFETFQDDIIESLIAEGRRFGFSCILAHQTLAQLSARLRALILGNVGLVIAFRLSRDDSTVISKVMTGDPKALNFAELPTGQAWMWRQGADPLLIEINGPLIKNFGQMSAEAIKYRQLLRDKISVLAAEEVSEKEKDDPGSNPSLGDWL